MRIDKPSLAIWLAVSAAIPAFAETPFDTLKAMQGTWTIESAGKALAIQMTYDLASKNSILTERFGKELSVFYQNAESVEMVHFCNAGNQPRLRLKDATQPHTLDFEVFSATNLSSPDAPHVVEIIYHFSDPNTVKLEIVWGPQNRHSEDYTLKRIRDDR